LPTLVHFWAYSNHQKDAEKQHPILSDSGKSLFYHHFELVLVQKPIPTTNEKRGCFGNLFRLYLLGPGRCVPFSSIFIYSHPEKDAEKS
jgi:hypothetical protein